MWPAGAEIQCVIRDDQMVVVVVRLELEFHETGRDYIDTALFIKAGGVVVGSRWFREVD
jgi:hypothetical protein